MGKFIDLTGARFGGLVVIEQAESENHNRRWLCRCDCGGTRVVATDKLNAGRVARCLDHFEWHGDGGTKLYNTWKRINQRCYNENVERFPHYGGRGIENRFESYRQFKEWSLENGFAEGLSIDRIDNNGHYAPHNCRWVGAATQMRNTSRNKLTASDVARIKGDRLKGVAYRTLAARFGVSLGCVSAIINGRTWTDIEPA